MSRIPPGVSTVPGCSKPVATRPLLGVACGCISIAVSGLDAPLSEREFGHLTPSVRQSRFTYHVAPLVNDQRGYVGRLTTSTTVRRTAPRRDGGQSRDRDDGSDEFDRWTEETVAAMRRSDAVRIDVYVRSMLPPAGAKESQVTDISRFQAVAERPLVDEVSVNVWGDRLCLCDSCRTTEPGRVMIGTVRDFEAWGENFDASAAPFFERRQVSSSVTGGTYESISPPRVTAAVYVSGTVTGVFPCERT